MKYESYDRLKADYRDSKVPFEEYRKYLGRLLGVSFAGYPDFTDDYFRDMNAQVEADAKACATRVERPEPVRKKRVVIVRRGPDDDIRVYSFDTKKSAREYLSSLVEAGGRYSAVDTLSFEDYLYTLCETKHEPDKGIP